MKKLLLVAVLVSGSLITFAQEANKNLVAQVVATQDTYKEIPAEELPQAVVDAIAKNYPTAKVEKAYVNEAKQYKLELSLEDGTTGTLYADENGNWIEK